MWLKEFFEQKFIEYFQNAQLDLLSYLRKITPKDIYEQFFSSNVTIFHCENTIMNEYQIKRKFYNARIIHETQNPS